MAKNSFILYNDIVHMVSRLDNERKGILFQTILDYVNGEDVPDDLDIAVDAIFGGIKANLDLNEEKYQEKVDNLNKNKKSDRNQSEIRQKSDRNQIEIRQKSDRNQTEIESDTVTDTVTDTVIDTDTDTYLTSSDEEVRPTRGVELPRDWKTRVVNSWNELESFGICAIRGIKDNTPRHKKCRARLKQYGIDGFEEAIGKIKESSFLQGKNKRGFTASFDWFIAPSNFPKVLEGNYDDSKGKDVPRSQLDRVFREMYGEEDSS